MWYLTCRVEYLRRRSSDPMENSFPRSFYLGVKELSAHATALTAAIELWKSEKYKDPTLFAPQLVWIEDLDPSTSSPKGDK